MDTSLALHLALGIPAGILYSNASEWLVHRYVLHGLGKHKRSYWSFHWHEHHRSSRRDPLMYDDDYERLPFRRWDAHTRETSGLIAAAVLYLPLLWLVPGFYLGALYGGINYYRKHRRAHLDEAWAREHLPWHVDHHIGPNQDANWCVTRPWFDILLGTREPYVGTEREAEDRRRAAERAARRDAATPDHTGPAPDEAPQAAAPACEPRGSASAPSAPAAG